VVGRDPANGDYFILDFYALRDRLEARRPDLFLGGDE